MNCDCRHQLAVAFFCECRDTFFCRNCTLKHDGHGYKPIDSVKTDFSVRIKAYHEKMLQHTDGAVLALGTANCNISEIERSGSGAVDSVVVEVNEPVDQLRHELEMYRQDAVDVAVGCSQEVVSREKAAAKLAAEYAEKGQSLIHQLEMLNGNKDENPLQFISEFKKLQGLMDQMLVDVPAPISAAMTNRGKSHAAGASGAGSGNVDGSCAAACADVLSRINDHVAPFKAGMAALSQNSTDSSGKGGLITAIIDYPKLLKFNAELLIANQEFKVTLASMVNTVKKTAERCEDMEKAVAQANTNAQACASTVEELSAKLAQAEARAAEYERQCSLKLTGIEERVKANEKAVKETIPNEVASSALKLQEEMANLRIAAPSSPPAAVVTPHVPVPNPVPNAAPVPTPPPPPTPVVPAVVVSPARPRVVAPPTVNCNFSAPFDTNGILYYLGTQGHSRPYTNPYLLEAVECSMSSKESMYGFEHKVVSHTPDGPNRTKDMPNSYMMVDFNNFKVRPTHYCLRHDNWSSNFMTSWRLLGSNNPRGAWTTLDDRSGMTDALNNTNKEASFEVGTPSNEPFRYIKVMQRGKNASGNFSMHLGGLEVYGTLYKPPGEGDAEIDDSSAEDASGSAAASGGESGGASSSSDGIVACDFRGVPFDEGGVFYCIGSDRGKRQYVNPHESGDVVVSLSSRHEGFSFEHKFVGRIESGPNRTQNLPMSFMMVDLGATRQVKVTHYCLKHDSYGVNNYMRDWVLQGSSNGDDWLDLDRRSGMGTLMRGAFKAASFELTPSARESFGFFRFFRVMQTGANGSGTHYFMCGGFELYGLLKYAN